MYVNSAQYLLGIVDKVHKCKRGKQVGGEEQDK